MKKIHVKKKENENLTEANKEKYVSELEKQSIQILDETESVKGKIADYYSLMHKENLTEDANLKADSFKRAAKNISKAALSTIEMQDELRARSKDIEREHSKNILTGVPANSTLDLKEKEINHFASGVNYHKLTWICFIASFAGTIVEMLWCLVSNGYIEGRASLVYGPFNLIYGFGGVLLSLLLYKFRNKGWWAPFLGGFVVGTVFEYICSWGQEMVLGACSWDYSNMPFNINGRVCLLYSIFWGLLGVLWIKNLYPRMSKWILKIPNKIGKILTWVIIVFFVINSLVSVTALFRWTARHNGIEAQNSFWEFVDERFPDERMEKVYANMEFYD